MAIPAVVVFPYASIDVIRHPDVKRAVEAP